MALIIAASVDDTKPQVNATDEVLGTHRVRIPSLPPTTCGNGGRRSSDRLAVGRDF
jgi:hypothetical protein